MRTEHGLPRVIFLAMAGGNKSHDLCSYTKTKTFHEGQRLLPESHACALDAYTPGPQDVLTYKKGITKT